ncbi:MAG TPA: sigma-70 family RNA polymerase sigma factor [Solirubrobacteraceae bacterium]|nr:sigma-70 family RNA polymerase sigma factor [Solirubrobacteraceae bacterium]
MSVPAVATRSTDGETEDRDLVARVRAGDERAFELLFARYQPRVAAYARRTVRDAGRAEDITQEVFIAALRHLRERGERDLHFKPWIFEIAKNKCIDSLRRARHTNEVSFDAREALSAEEQGRLAEPSASPDSAVQDKVAMDNLRGAFGGLSPEHHEILVLRELAGLSYREIGERLGMSGPAVESALFRARKRLTEEYEELVSGERCRRVQRLIDEDGGRRAGRRDRRRMARHLAHCQPCRRHACRAGVDLGAVVRPPAAAAARIAAFLPLPAFLRRRWGGDDAATAPLLGQGGAMSQWPANAATVLDPGILSSWTKAVATAATVAVAGMGAGAAMTDRNPFGASGGSQPPRSAPAGSGAGAAAPAARRDARDRARRTVATNARGNRSPGGAGAGASIVADRAEPKAAPHSHRGTRRAVQPPAAAPPGDGAAPSRRGEAGTVQPDGTLRRIIGAVGSGDRDPQKTGGGAVDAAAPRGSSLLDTSVATSAGATDASAATLADSAGEPVPAATAAADSAMPTAPGSLATPAALQSLGR